jgi:hypothetical protein
MESVERPDVAAARAALGEVADAQRAVRDNPWPVWLYPANAALLGLITLSTLLDPTERTSALLALSLAVVGLNLSAGYRMGTPWALPTSRTFLASVGVSVLCFVLALAVVGSAAWLVPVLAVVATGTYLLGSLAHWRSTR